MRRWAVFVSGEGSNLQNFLNLEPRFKSQCIAAVFADRPCRAIERARTAHKPTLVVSPKEADFQERLLRFLSSHQVDSIFLMGYMRLLSADFLKSWKGTIVNLHPSLLPAYKGKDAVARAFHAKEKVIGVSLHEVVEEVDSGRILKQMPLPVTSSDTLDELTERVHSLERKIVEDYLFDLDVKDSAR